MITTDRNLHHRFRYVIAGSTSLFLLCFAAGCACCTQYYTDLERGIFKDTRLRQEMISSQRDRLPARCSAMVRIQPEGGAMVPFSCQITWDPNSCRFVGMSDLGGIMFLARSSLREDEYRIDIVRNKTPWQAEDLKLVLAAIELTFIHPWVFSGHHFLPENDGEWLCRQYVPTPSLPNLLIESRVRKNFEVRSTTVYAAAMFSGYREILRVSVASHAQTRHAGLPDAIHVRGSSPAVDFNAILVQYKPRTNP